MRPFRENHTKSVYTPDEKSLLAQEFSPALAEVLEVVAPVIGKVQLLSRKTLDIVASEVSSEEKGV